MRLIRTIFLILILSACLGLVAEIAGYPYFAYSNETGALGGAFLFLKKPFPADPLQQPDYEISLIANSLYSVRHQFLAAFIPSFKDLNAHWKLQSSISLKLWPDDYYGLGNQTDEEPLEAYESQLYEAESLLQYGFGSQTLFVTLNALQGLHRYRKTLAGGKLQSIDLAGIEDSYYSGLGMGAIFNNTDSEFYPTRGILASAEQLYFREAWGSDHKYDKSRFDFRAYYPLGSVAVLASQSDLVINSSGVPIFNYMELGNRLRAFESKRFLDKTRIAQRLELRVSPFDRGIKRRIGYVIFGETGQVAPTVSDLSTKDFHWSTGMGLRFSVLPRERLNVRMDFGYGEGSFNVIINAREAF